MFLCQEHTTLSKREKDQKRKAKVKISNKVLAQSPIYEKKNKL